MAPSNRKLKLGFFTYSLPQPGKSWGGVASVAHALANGLADHGHHVIVWCYQGKPTGARYEVRSLPGEAIFNHPLGRRLLMGYGGNLLAPFLKTADCDLYAFHGDSLLAPLLGRPSVRIFHGSALDESLHSTSPVRRVSQRLIYELEKLSSVSGTFPVAVSQTTQRRFDHVTTVIPNGLDLTRFRPAPERKTAHPSILFVGAIDGRKRGGMMLDLFGRLKKKLPALHLDFVGSFSGTPPAGVTVHRGIGDDELVALYQRAWVFASPSQWEGFGLPYVEAMACGTPVLATPNPGSAEITDNGLYGCLAADDEFGTRLDELLANSPERDRWVSQGIKRAADYDLEKSVAKYEELFLALVNDPK